VADVKGAQVLGGDTAAGSSSSSGSGSSETRMRLRPGQGKYWTRAQSHAKYTYMYTRSSLLNARLAT
jgi:hypothetical protein